MSKITLVDDDVEFCEATQILLESMGYEVTIAYDGKHGLEKIRKTKPDLVILDVMMPEMNGYDLCVVLKADPELKEIPVILLTGVDKAYFQTAYSKHMGMMTEADDYIAKPVDSEELSKRVSSFIGSGKD
jgi:two-component system alkaline phosphatase synthesis response regulator PhoP